MADLESCLSVSLQHGGTKRLDARRHLDVDRAHCEREEVSSELESRGIEGRKRTLVRASVLWEIMREDGHEGSSQPGQLGEQKLGGAKESKALTTSSTSPSAHDACNLSVANLALRSYSPLTV